MKVNVLLLLSLAILLGFSTCSSVTNKVADKQNSTEVSASSVVDIPVGLSVGYRAPELEFPSPDGKKLSLSSLRGKIVLIDFWASWCPPCRIENPNLVNVFNSYKDKKFNNGDGFTIYSVSLDQDRSKWIDAIKSDNLSWKNHVSDLKGWQAVPAAMYQIRAIPSSFLIDGEGIIIATNLRGETLITKLNELLI